MAAILVLPLEFLEPPDHKCLVLIESITILSGKFKYKSAAFGVYLVCTKRTMMSGRT